MYVRLESTQEETTFSKMEEVRLSGAIRSVPKGPSVEMAYQYGWKNSSSLP